MYSTVFSGSKVLELHRKHNFLWHQEIWNGIQEIWNGIQETAGCQPSFYMGSDLILYI